MKKQSQDISAVIDAILAGNLNEVKTLYNNGSLLYKKGKVIQLRKNIPEVIGSQKKPFTIYMDAFRFALSHGQMEIAKFFVDCKILDSDALFSAIKHPELFSYMLDQGIPFKKTQGEITSLFLHLADVWDDTWPPMIDKMDLPLKEHGGPSLCYAAQYGHMKIAEYLLGAGVSVDCRDKSLHNTPVLCAVKGNQFQMVKYLIARGADLTLTDSRGICPYTAARLNNHTKMAAYIRSHEPEDRHSEAAKDRLLEAYQVPEDMQAYLKNGNRKLEFPEEEQLRWIRFFSYIDIPEVSYQGKKGLSLVEDSEDYDFLLLWEPESKKIWFLDLEHDIFHAVCTWPEFMQHPGKYVNRAVLWDFE